MQPKGAAWRRFHAESMHAADVHGTTPPHAPRLDAAAHAKPDLNKGLRSHHSAQLPDMRYMILDDITHTETPMEALLERPHVVTWTGTPEEVRQQLHKSNAQRVVVLDVDNFAPEQFAAFANNIDRMAISVADLLAEPIASVYADRLVELFMPKQPPSKRIMRDAAALAKAKLAVLYSGDFITASDIASLVGSKARNPSAQPNQWKKSNSIFAIRHLGADYFPLYGLDPDEGYRPIACLKDILDIFKDKKDGWTTAFWFHSKNSFLSGRRPQDLLQTDAVRVKDAAMREVAGVTHG